MDHHKDPRWTATRLLWRGSLKDNTNSPFKPNVFPKQRTLLKLDIASAKKRGRQKLELSRKVVNHWVNMHNLAIGFLLLGAISLHWLFKVASSSKHSRKGLPSPSQPELLQPLLFLANVLSALCCLPIFACLDSPYELQRLIWWETWQWLEDVHRHHQFVASRFSLLLSKSTTRFDHTSTGQHWLSPSVRALQTWILFPSSRVEFRNTSDEQCQSAVYVWLYDRYYQRITNYYETVLPWSPIMVIQLSRGFSSLPSPSEPRHCTLRTPNSARTPRHATAGWDALAERTPGATLQKVFKLRSARQLLVKLPPVTNGLEWWRVIHVILTSGENSCQYFVNNI